MAASEVSDDEASFETSTMDWTTDDPDAVVVSRLIAAMNRVSGTNEQVRLGQELVECWRLHSAVCASVQLPSWSSVMTSGPLVPACSLLTAAPLPNLSAMQGHCSHADMDINMWRAL